jgi:hypothetical protein
LSYRRHGIFALIRALPLQAKGKPHKVIQIALMRKLLVRLNAKARDACRALALDKRHEGGGTATDALKEWSISVSLFGCPRRFFVAA